MLALIHPNVPRAPILLVFRAPAARALQHLTGRRVEREREEVLRLHEVRHEARVRDEVAQDEQVDDEDGYQYDVEDALPLLSAAG